MKLSFINKTETPCKRSLATSKRSLSMPAAISIFIALSIGYTANACFNRHQLIKMQGTTLGEMTSFMQMEGWRFAGVSELAQADHFGKNVSNSAVQWVQGYDNERVYFYDNEDAGNFIVMMLSDYCYATLFSEFSADLNGITSVHDNSLLTTFTQGGIRIEFAESANSGNQIVRIYNPVQLDKYKLVHATATNPNKEGNSYYRNDDDFEAPAEVVTVIKEEKPDQVFESAEEFPIYPGGEAQMQRDIRDNVQYPEMEKENNIQGKVFVQLVVEKDGSVSDVKVLKGVPGGPNLNTAAEKAIKKLKKFTPAKMNGRPVRLKMVIPVNFTLK